MAWIQGVTFITKHYIPYTKDIEKKWRERFCWRRSDSAWRDFSNLDL